MGVSIILAWFQSKFMDQIISIKHLLYEIVISLKSVFGTISGRRTLVQVSLVDRMKFVN